MSLKQKGIQGKSYTKNTKNKDQMQWPKTDLTWNKKGSLLGLF